MRFACLLLVLTLPFSCSKTDSDPARPAADPAITLPSEDPVPTSNADISTTNMDEEEVATSNSEKPAPEKNHTAGRVYTMEELLNGIENRRFKYGERVKVRGVIGAIDLYDTYIDEDSTCEIELESGVPDLSIEKERFGSCDFSSPDQLFDLAIGQSVVVEGEVGTSLTFMLEECKLVSAGERLLSQLPRMTAQEVKDHAKEDSELAKSLNHLNEDLNINARSGTWDDEYLEIKVTIDEEEAADISEEEFDALSKLPILSRLLLYGLSDDGAKRLAKLAYCEELLLHCENLTGDGLGALLSLPGLQRLRLFSTDGLDGKTLDHLKSVPGLWELALFGDDPDSSFQGSAGDALQALRHTQELRYLEFNEIGGTDEDLSELSKLKHLRRLSIHYCRFNGSGLKSLSEADNFWFASLWGESFTDDIAEALKELKTLRRLELDETSVTGKVGEGFTSFEHLEELEIKNSSLDSGFGPHLRHCVSLTELVLSDNPIDDNLVLPVEQISKLDWIILSRTEVGDNVCAQLSRLPKLRMLWLDETRVTDAGLEALVSDADIPLKEVSFRKTEITEAGVASLLKLESLKKVTISDTVMISDELKKRYEDQGVTLSMSKY